MGDDHNDNQSSISSVVREEASATDSHNHGTLSQTDDFKKQLITLLKKLIPSIKA